jgi:hypothetical protein
MSTSKNPFLLFLTCYSLFGSAYAADSIGWNYDGLSSSDILAPEQVAGVAPYAQANWNNHAGSGQGAGTVPFALINSDGEDSGASVTAWTVNANSWHMGYGSTDPNEMLMDSFNDKNPSITFSNIPEDYLESGYSVVVYYSQNEGPASSVLTVTGNVNDVRSRTITTGDEAAGYRAIGFLEGTSENTSVATNYTVFTGLDDSGFTVALANNNNNGICAIQIVRETGPPTEPVNITPVDDFFGDYPLALSATLSWTASKRVTEYEVYMWKDGDTEPSEPTATVSTTSYDPPGDLDPSSTYLWKLVAVGPEGDTPSDTWTFWTGDGGVPGEPWLPYPDDGSLKVSVEESLFWEPAASAESYEIYLWTSSETEPTEPTATSPNASYDPPTNFSPSTTYNWRVVAVNTAGRTPGPLWTFTTSDFFISSRLSIGWNYDGVSSSDTLLATDGAGAPGFGQKNWNNHAGSGQGVGTVPFSLSDSSGSPTTAQVTAWTLSMVNSWAHQYSSTVPQEKLMDSFNNREPAITFTNLPADYISAGYTIVVYYGNNEGPSTSTLTVDGSLDDFATRSIITGNTSQAGYRAVGFVEEAGALEGPTNYSIFVGLNDPSVTVSLTGANNNGISAIQIVKETGAPNAPTTPLPADLATDVAVNADLSWTAGLRADTYDVYLWKSSDLVPETPTATGLTGVVYNPPSNLDPLTNYSWKVVSVNAEGSASSAVWTFTTGEDLAPALASNPTPADGAINIVLVPSFNWSSAARSTSYELHLWKTSESASGSPTHTGSLPGYTPASPLDANTSYSWRVDTVNGAGTTTGTVWTFTTGTPPVIAGSPEPADDATGITRQVALNWTDSAGAVTYNVYLWPASESAPGTPTATTSGSGFVPLSLLEANTEYLWRVDAVNPYGTTVGSTWSFTTSSGISTRSSIGYNYANGTTSNDTLVATDVAGAPTWEQANWNTHEGSSQGVGTVPFALNDNTGSPSGAEVTFFNLSTVNSWNNGYGGSNPNGRLMNAFANQNPTITFNGIPAEYVEAGYRVVVYYGDNEQGSSGNRATVITLTGTDDDSVTRTVKTGGSTSQWQNVGYVEGLDGADITNTGSNTNFTVFAGLDDESFTIAFAPFAGQNNHGLVAVQIVKNGDDAPVGSDYENWALEAGLSGGDHAFGADPDGDGVENGLEFLLGGQPNPALPDSNSLALLPTVEAAGDDLVFTFTRVDAAASIEAIVEFSTSLNGDWTVATGLNSTIDIDEGEGTSTVTVTIPKNDAPKLFARLRAVDPAAPPP